MSEIKDSPAKARKQSSPRISVDGIILVDKPAGISSFGVVSRIKARFRFRKVGHGGTLDPMATGLLIILVGRATKTAQQLLEGDKRYRGEVQLGLETDSQDITGKVLTRSNPDQVGKKDIQEALAGFRGDIMQVPPMVSALKHRGKPLYRLAREGITIERSPRPVRISSLELTSFDLPRFTFEVACSKGTYIRTLAHDLGRVLGCGGCLSSLRRTRVGRWDLEQASPLEEIMDGAYPSFLLPWEDKR